MIKNIIKYTAMVATATLLPVALYTIVISIYKFYLLIAGGGKHRA